MKSWMIGLTLLVGAGCVQTGPEKVEEPKVIDFTEEDPVDPKPVDGEDDNPVVTPKPTDTTDPEEPETPVDWVDDGELVRFDLGGASLRCVSALVDHDGTHYVVDVTHEAETSLVEISRVKPAGAVLDETRSEPTSEVVWSEAVPFDGSGFWGFETADHWLAMDGSPTSGPKPTARMGQLDPEREPLVAQREQTEINLWCWQEEQYLPARYDADSGKCLTKDGVEAMNDVPFLFVRGTGWGQCTELAGQLNEEAFGYPSFVGLDLRGAVLDGAALHFANILDARLEGADLANFSFGYATVSGSIDEHTVVPADMFCDAPDAGSERFECMQ